MDTQEDLQKLRAELRKCQSSASQLELKMAGRYIAHAIENVDAALMANPARPAFRSIKGGKSDL